MELKTEHLPGEAEDTLADGERKVKLIIASSHSIPKIGNFSLFQNPFADSDEGDESVPEVPFHPQAEMMFDTDPTEEKLVSEYAESEEESAEVREISFELPLEDGDDIEARLFQMLETILDEKKTQQEDEPDRYVFRCDGVMSVKNGSVVIRYEEDDSGGMGETQAEIVLHGGRRDMVSIVRTGSVANTLVCERGRRHISAYNTPIMPFQICVFTKECEQNVTLESGGTIYMNYYVELRGTEMQHTKMRITVKPV